MRLLERCEAAAEEGDHRVDLHRDFFRGLPFRARAFASLREDGERGGQAGSDELRTEVACRNAEILGDCRGDHLLELSDSRSQMAAQRLVVVDAAAELLVDLAPLPPDGREDELAAAGAALALRLRLAPAERRRACPSGC